MPARTLLSRIGRRIQRVLRPEQRWAADPTEGVGHTALDAETRLERSALADTQEIVALLQPRDRRMRLVHHWASWSEDCVEDLPTLRDLHLGWAQSVDYIAISWDLHREGAERAGVAAAVDAWHQDYGLTWRSLIHTGEAAALRRAAGLSSSTLPQTTLLARDGERLWHSDGALGEVGAADLERLIEARRWQA